MYNTRVRIENRLPKKQKAHGGRSAKGLISIRLEVIGQCRRHHNPLTKTPVRAGTLAGVVIRATEAAQTVQVHYPAFDPRDQGRSHMTCHNCRIEEKRRKTPETDYNAIVAPNAVRHSAREKSLEFSATSRSTIRRRCWRSN